MGTVRAVRQCALFTIRPFVILCTYIEKDLAIQYTVLITYSVHIIYNTIYIYTLLMGTRYIIL